MDPETADYFRGQLAETKAGLANYHSWLKAAEEQLLRVKEQLAKQNDFAADLDAHFEVSESHMTRIEQAIMYEL